MKRLLVPLLCFAIIFAPQSVRATNFTQDPSDKVVELRKAIDELRTVQGVSEKVRQITLKRLVDELAELLKQQLATLQKEKAAVVANPNLSSTAKAKLVETYDQLIAEVNSDQTAYSSSNIPGNNSAGNNSGSSSLSSSSVPTNGSASTTNLSSTAVPVTSSSNSTPVVAAAAPAAQNVINRKVANPVTVCGQIRPASLTQIFAMIGSSVGVLPNTRQLAQTAAVQNSRLKDDCNANTQQIEDLSTVLPAAGGGAPVIPVATATPSPGSQKDAIVVTLKWLLWELQDKKVREELSKTFGGLSEDTVRKQILLLQGYVGNAKVTIENDAGEKLTLLTDKDGNFSTTLPPNTKYYFSTEADSSGARREIYLDHEALRINLPLEDRPVSLLSRAVVGYEQAGASATKKSQDYFFDLFVSSTFPFKQKIDPDFGERFRSWIDFRFASVPQSGDATVGELSTGLSTQISGLKVRDVANVFEFLGGFEYRLAGNAALLPSFDRKTKQKFSLSLIAGGGVTTPTNSLDSLTVFKVFPDAPGLPPEAKTKEFVAFVQSDRDRFFRQYYAGLRLQTFFFNSFNMPMQRFPAQLDLTIGQNEFVTGGKLKGPVVRVEGYFPLPFEDLKFLNIFGTALLRPGRSTFGTPLVLQPAPDTTVVPASNVALIALPQPNRDYYRVGFGLDFISFVQKLREALAKK